MRSAFYISAAVVLLGALFIPTPVPTRQHRSWIDAVTGSMKYEIVSPLGKSSGEIVEPSPLQQRLESANIPWTPDWRFLHNTRRTIFGKAVSYECGFAPPIHQIRSVLNELAQISSEEQLRDFAKIMQSGNEEEQQAAVEAAEESIFRAMQR